MVEMMGTDHDFFTVPESHANQLDSFVLGHGYLAEKCLRRVPTRL